MQQKSEKDSGHFLDVIHYAKAFFSGTLLSRVFGMFRDIVLAMLFGTGQCLASFMVAFRFANLFRRLFAESSLSSSFIPMLEKKRGESQRQSDLFFRDVFFLLFILGSVVIIFLEIFLYFFSSAFSLGLFFEVMPLIRIMLPSLVFLMLYGLCLSYLQCRGQYFIGAFAPVIFNIVWCAFAFFVRDMKALQAMRTLSWGINLAFFAQFFVVFFVIAKSLLKTSSIGSFFSGLALKETATVICKPYFLSMIGIGAVQFNTLIDGIFSKVADVSGPAYLWYAIRLEQVPLALFSIALGSALLPTLSRAAKNYESHLFKFIIEKALKKNFLLMCFSCFSLWILGFMIIRLIFYRGAFSALSFSMTLKCLWAYLAGLPFQGGVVILSQGFYATRAFKVPVKASLVAVFVNCVCNILCVFVFHLGAISIALSTSLASMMNYFYLVVAMDSKIRPRAFSFFLRSLVISCLSTSCVLMILFYIKDPSFYAVVSWGRVLDILSFSKTFLHLILSSVIFTIVFLLGSKLLKLEEIFLVFRKR